MKIKKKKRKNTKVNKIERNGKGKRKRRSIWKILLTIFILGCIAVIFAVFAFCMYIVLSTGEFDPNALANSDRTIVYDSKGNEIATLGTENRESIKYDDLPDVLVDAIIATEDSRFFQHNGVDTARFMKAAIGQVLGNSSAGGASTLTMQVVKNNLTSTEQTIIRKFKDVYLAVFFMEKNYTKEEILEFYVNDSSLGGGTYGVEEASQYYFGKSVKELSLPEAAVIAGLFQAPTKYNPRRNPEETAKRRSTVLKLMVKHGYITQEEADVANSIDISSMLVPLNEEDSPYQSYIDEVVDEVQEKTDQSPYLVSMKIYTNLDTSIQDGISAIMTSDDTSIWKDKVVQGATTIIDVKTGAIVALGGGRNREGERSYNYATQAYRQPGSTAKPIFAYGPGFEYNNFSTYELFYDEAWSYSNGTSFNNWDAGYKGLLTLKQALAISRNVPAVKALQEVGTKNVTEFVNKLGFDFGHDVYESYAIGGLDTGATTVQMAAAYAAFANGGYYTEPYTVSKIVYRDTGEEVDMTPETNRVMKDSTAYLVTNALEYAANYGFSGGTASYSGTKAVKTGTSNYSESIMNKYNLPGSAVNDLWSVAYTPQYSIAVWYGYDKVDSTYYNTSSSYKDNLVKAVMKTIPVCNDEFEMPSSVVASEVEYGSWPAQLPSEYTPSDLIMTEYFVKGSQPTEVSSRFSKLSDVTDLKATVNGNSVSVSWTDATPEVVKDDYLNEYFKQSVFGNSSSSALNERKNYINNTMGGFGYGIYEKDSSGKLKQVGFSTTNSYTYKSTSSGNVSVVVKAQYRTFTSNASDGVSTSVKLSNTITTPSLKSGLSVKFKETKTTFSVGKYDDTGVTVTYDGVDVSSKVDTITYTLINQSSQESTSYQSFDSLKTGVNSLSAGTYTIKCYVKYNDEDETVSKAITLE